MKKTVRLTSFLVLIVFMLTTTTKAQTLSGTYNTSWIANTFGEGLSCGRTCGRWVQNDILAAAVSKDGKIYTNSLWDEGGRTAGIYTVNNVIGDLAIGEYIPNVGKVGNDYSAQGWSVAVNDNNVFATRASSIYKFNLNGSNGILFAPCNAYGLSANNSVLAASDNSSNMVRIYNTGGTETTHWTVTKPGAIAIDPNGEIWVVTCTARGGDKDNKYWVFNQSGITKVQHYSITGTLINEISDPLGNNNWLPTCLAFHIDGRLMIGDSGMRCQILLYDVSATPSLNATFGDNGGIGSGVPGEDTPLKFWGITGVGCTSTGNIVVTMYERGSAIRTFDSNGNLLGALYGLQFADCMDFDPASDGADAYGINEHATLDLTKTVAGTEWSLKAITYHKNAYPTDPRGSRTDVLSMASTVMRRVNGNLLMFTTGMYAGTLDVYKFKDELAIYCQTFNLGVNAYEPDVDGNVWYVLNNIIKKIPLSGFTNGTPTFGSSQDIAANPGAITSIERIYYNKVKDEMYFTGDIPSPDWGIIGTKIAKYTNWSTTKTLAWKNDLMYGPNIPGDNRQKAIAFTDDYFFTVGVIVRCKVNVFKTSDGTKVGELIPGAEVNGLDATGWVDIPYGIRATKRINGEYLLLVEEDGFGKTLMFRWKPAPCSSIIPTAPGNLTADSQSATQINLSWTDNSNNENGFIIERKTGIDSSYTQIALVLSNVKSFTDAGLTVSKQYYYRVKAYNCAGNSNYSAAVNAIPVCTQTSPNAPSKLSLTVQSSSIINISWIDNSNNEDGFKIERKTGSNGTYSEIANLTSGKTNYSNTGLADSTQYYYRVSAYNCGGTSVFSEEVNAITRAYVRNKLIESFDYPVGDINGKGTANGGWGGPWVSNGGVMNVIDGNLGNDNVGKTAKTITGTTVLYYRELNEKWIDDGSDIWISFYIQRLPSATLSWGGLSLFNGTSEDLFIGSPNGTGLIGFDSKTTTFSDLDLNQVLVKCEMNGTTAQDSAFMWVNYSGTSEPYKSTALIKTAWGTDGFTKIRIGNDASYSIMYDKIRIATTFNDAVTSLSSLTSKQISLELYPNPFSDVLNLSATADKISVYSVEGGLIKMFDKTNKINLSNMKAGLYLLKISLDGQTISKLIVKEQ